ncbi:MAG: DUF1015 domain-containing protein [Clostridia bacterium]
MSTIVKPNILLPKQNIDKAKWSCVACDQFTSQPDYWSKLADFVGDAPSCLNMIMPEVFLANGDLNERIEKINQNMQTALSDDIFDQINDLVLVERTQSDHLVRVGLMLAVDLEDYDYTPNNKALIKATEKTVEERLPIRIEVRKNASLELPHIMLLMDDKENAILGGLLAKKNKLEKLYDFDLNMQGGHLTGFRVDNSDEVIKQIESLADKKNMLAKYGVTDSLLFAVGDGNHSLATAKECWNAIKKGLSEQEKAAHPSRFALCELVNLYDNALSFQPIHRVAFNAGEELVDFLVKKLQGDESTKIVFRGKETLVNIPAKPSDAIADIQQALDEFVKQNQKVELDYIHGEEHLMQVANKKDGVAIFMPTLAKDSLFDYVIRRGVLPRKSFSMGHAEDKRYYCECKKIK